MEVAGSCSSMTFCCPKESRGAGSSCAEVWKFGREPASNHNRAIHQNIIIRPIGHNVWASYDHTKKKWQSVNTEACIPKGQLGYICENAVVGNEDLCLDTEDSACTFEMLPHTKTQSQVYYVGNGCACVRTFCVNFTIDTCHEVVNDTNFCVCNFTKIIGCDFNYTIPITTEQLIENDYLLYHDRDTNRERYKSFQKMFEHLDIEKMVQEANKTQR
ncbi:PREDICTED: uncharacterized protein LOC108495470 [Lepidothrix coronata]|uniref:Uncharacterized protein LOC108495470 n=1 Tax=Lepidothrix coronata TaxID=321398 RepID=A0A6J0GWT1_9PASS|nr:PREDICTED: uncharacterized protein LOC108495470 [Lepidothrix coronata]